VVTLRLARYCARNPLALDRLTYEPATEQLTYRSDKADGPTAGTQTENRLEFLACYSTEPQSVPVSLAQHRRHQSVHARGGVYEAGPGNGVPETRTGRCD
jgi:hypothetical protein